mmetsp:Transcript_32293/g.102706  ORF Transcript_32293/g.102706 Transcript_32293/m.102706 type:complete len:466 (-) Transcript_32293:93-1490(-)|eukprot:CAMPEP_0182897010 /NCGR_PEP_ID=MMETSP0034_2-20130328/26626_1 /TAXON_ID=156128 /ORGANISM="Nephroselmis pyriformis, Strain CCMP717" /LENGTH=465 /DNA_ID=CAMNT_0025030903 /DNA_START=116 /DNA_END=1513 /DNA_ORIENTATION=-
MSRPGSGLQLGVTGSAPPRTGTGARTGSKSKTAGADEMKAALTSTLVQKMREKFSGATMTNADQEVIAKSVKEMLDMGRIKEEDFNMLEQRIQTRLTGGTPGPIRPSTRGAPKVPGMNKLPENEWAVIDKFEVEQWSMQEKLKKQKDTEKKMKMRLELDSQMQAHAAKEAMEKELDIKFHLLECEEVEQWKKDEIEKKARKAAAMEKLKSERDEQMKDKKERLHQAYLKKKREEEQARAMVRQEVARKLEDESNHKKKLQSEMEALKKANELNKKIKDEEKKKNWDDEMRMAAEYAAKLENEEKKRLGALAKMEEDQRKKREKAQKTYETKSNQEKEELDKIEKHAKAYEAAAVRRDEARKAAVVQREEDVKKALAKQLAEKQARKAALKEEEVARYEQFMNEQKEMEEAVKARKAAERSRMLSYKAELQAQMDDNAVRRRQGAMDPVEKSMNKKLLEEIGTWAG